MNMMFHPYGQLKLYTLKNKIPSTRKLTNIKINHHWLKYREQGNITAGETSLFTPPPITSIMLKYLSGKYATIFDYNKTRKLKYSSMHVHY